MSACRMFQSAPFKIGIISSLNFARRKPLKRERRTVLDGLTRDFKTNEQKNIKPSETCGRRICVLYTGGTIGMMRNQKNVLAPIQNRFVESIRDRSIMHDAEGYESLPNEMKSPTRCLLPLIEGVSHQILYDIIEYNPLLDSSNVGAKEWTNIVTDIEKYYDLYDGFVVLHGTDTLSYTASVLSFSLGNLAKTVIVTGSQLSIFETRNDGIINFINALIIAGMYDIPEVCVIFGDKLLRGNRTGKTSCSDFDAFVSPNAPVLGNIQMKIELDKLALRPMPVSCDLNVQKKFNSNIVIMRLIPNIPSQMLSPVLNECTQGIILHTFGSGNIPSDREDILNTLRAAADRGIIIVNITQCLHGMVEPIYETGSGLYECGVIPGYDMTEEAAYAKLACILEQDLSVEEKKKKMKENLCGELTLPVEVPFCGRRR